MEETIMLTIRTILHPTDFSEGSHAAFRLACSLARGHEARLIVLHVGRHPVIVPAKGAEDGPERFREELTMKLENFQAEEPGAHIETRLLFADDPAGVIVKLAEQLQPHLIVLGTHGRTGLGRVLMGSVAEQVVRRAPCPVVTLKTALPERHPSAKQAPDVATV
jgi:nucleotide-binding universal stress UspA family protein